MAQKLVRYKKRVNNRDGNSSFGTWQTTRVDVQDGLDGDILYDAVRESLLQTKFVNGNENDSLVMFRVL